MSARPDTWMPFYVADYLRDTMRLTRDQHGGYLLLLMDCWANGGRLPSDPAELAAIAKATPAEWRKLAPVLLRYFKEDDEGLYHSRVMAEHQKAARLSEIRRQNGGKGGRPPKQKETEAKPVAFPEDKLTETPSPSPVGMETNVSTQLSDANASSSPSGDKPECPEDFEACWKAYPHVRGRSSKSKSFRYWRRVSAHRRALLPQAIARYAREGREPNEDCGAPAMERWLRDTRYLDWLEPAQPSASLWSGPAEIREAFVAVHGEDFARSYLDPCTWQDVPTRAVIPRTGVAAAKLRTEAAATLRRQGVEIVDRAA